LGLGWAALRISLLLFVVDLTSGALLVAALVVVSVLIVHYDTRALPDKVASGGLLTIQSGHVDVCFFIAANLLASANICDVLVLRWIADEGTLFRGDPERGLH